MYIPFIMILMAIIIIQYKDIRRLKNQINKLNSKQPKSKNSTIQKIPKELQGLPEEIIKGYLNGSTSINLNTGELKKPNRKTY